jgi:hypothetical protein
VSAAANSKSSSIGESDIASVSVLCTTDTGLLGSAATPPATSNTKKTIAGRVTPPVSGFTTGCEIATVVSTTGTSSVGSINGLEVGGSTVDIVGSNLIAVRAFCPAGYQAISGGCFVGLEATSRFVATTPTPNNLAAFGGGGFVLPSVLTSQVCIGSGVVSADGTTQAGLVNGNLAAQVFCQKISKTKSKKGL